MGTEFTLGKWEVDQDSEGRYYVDSWLEGDEGGYIPIAKMTEHGEPKANAQLIVAAVNACFAINKDNPLAVAEAIGEVWEALRDAVNHCSECGGHNIHVVFKGKEAIDVQRCPACKPWRDALSKADGKP